MSEFDEGTHPGVSGIGAELASTEVGKGRAVFTEVSMEAVDLLISPRDVPLHDESI
jgi:hypothetical protein